MPRDERETLLQGTLELLVLKTLTLGPQHGWGISQRIEELSGEAFAVNQGAIYPALQRLRARGWITARWQTTEQNRRARYYRLTAEGERQLVREVEWWRRVAAGVDGVLGAGGPEA
jgi:PadR family transcriptional regulator, regulatory protein PadR